MEAIILTGGLGTRLRSLVSSVPKVMAPIGDKPFLDILASKLIKEGFSHLIFAVGYKSKFIKEYFGDFFKGVPITYSFEEEPLGTGGAIKRSIPACKEENIYIFNGDTYVELEFDIIKTKIKKSNIEILLIGKEVNDISRYGFIDINQGKVNKIIEKKQNGKGFINIGVYYLNKKYINKYSFPEKFSFEKDFLPLLIKKEKVDFFKTEGKFIDIGVPKDYLLANKLLKNLKK